MKENVFSENYFFKASNKIVHRGKGPFYMPGGKKNPNSYTKYLASYFNLRARRFRKILGTQLVRNCINFDF